MRNAVRLFASVKPARFLEAGNPTGLTGLYTHPTPRSTLIYLYNSTLDKLKGLPEHSVYRQSTEAVTRHRLKIVDSIIPNGYADWLKRAEKKIEENAALFDGRRPGPHSISERGGQLFVTTIGKEEEDERVEEWDGEKVSTGTLEGTRTPEERKGQKHIAQEEGSVDDSGFVWEPEPPLEASQINEMENQIGGGLIEEVIQVAEGELNLVDSMIESKVWEELDEKPPPGQWEYFARDHHTPGTQEPPT